MTTRKLSIYNNIDMAQYMLDQRLALERAVRMAVVEFEDRTTLKITGLIIHRRAKIEIESIAKLEAEKP